MLRRIAQVFALYESDGGRSSSGIGNPANTPATSASSPSGGSPPSGTGQPSESELWARAAATDDAEGSEHTDESSAEDADAAGAPSGEEDADAESEEAEAAEGEEEESPEKTEEDAEETASKDENAERPEIEASEPEYLKRVLEHVKDYPGAKKDRQIIQDNHYALVAYREQFGTVPEARKFREAFHTVEDALQARDLSSEYVDLQKQWESSPKDFWEGVATNDPQGLEAALVALPDVLASRIHPNTGELDTRLFAVLNRKFFETTMANLKAKYSEDEYATEILGKVEEMALGSKEQREAARRRQDDPLVKENERLKAEKRAREGKELGTFISARNSEFEAKLDDEIGKFLKGPIGAGGFTKGAQAKIHDEIRTAVYQLMGGNRIFDAELRRRTVASDLSPKSKDEIVRYMVNQAKARLDLAGRKVLQTWRKEILAANKKEITERERVASRRDPGTGQLTGTARSGVPARKPLSQMDPEEKRKHYGEGGTGPGGRVTDHDLFQRAARS